MKNKVFWIFLFLLFCLLVNTTFSQTAKQLKEKYGSPTESYSVSKYIWMTPEFTANGQVCRMRFYPKRVSSTTNYLLSKLDHQELQQVIKKFAPPKIRGKRSPFSGLINLRLGNMTTNYVYENIKFSFVVAVDPYFDPIDKDKPDEINIKQIKFSRKKYKKIISKEEMIVPEDVEIATIVWLKRKCAAK